MTGISGFRARARAFGVVLACWVAANWAVGAEWEGRPRVAFDRPGGFVVQQGEEETVTATLSGGSGGMWFAWEGNNGGTAAGDGGAMFVIDTSVPGEYWLMAVGGSDGTDGDFAGKIRFRVAGAEAAAKGTRAAGEGETLVWSEDFAGLISGSSTEVTSYNGWEASKAFNIDHNLRIGSGKASGHAISPSATLDGVAGRLEFSMWKYDSGAAVSLQRSTDGGTSWTDLASYSTLPDEKTEYTVDLPASASVKLKWSNGGSSQRFYLDDVAVYKSESGGGGTTASNVPPTIDLEPSATAVALMVGEMYSLDVIATEFEGDEITLSASGLPEDAVWAADDPKTGEAEGSFEWTPETTGTWTVVFAASDKDGTNTASVVFTVEPEGPGRLEFASEGVNVRESAGSVSLTVARRGGALGAVAVSWATADGTASAGSEYTAGSGTLTFSDGETSKTLTVAILDDTTAEENKSFTVTLGNATGGASLGDVAACTVTIVDDDDANASYYASCYKNGVLKTGSELKSTLCRILNTGVTTNQYTRVDNILEVIDVPEGASQVRCLYAQTGISAFNREHIWAQSHGIDQSLPGYSDLHHIRACTESLNSKRDDKDFDNCKGVSGAGSSMGCYYTSSAFEPPDAAKGDVARACLYMAVRYQGQYHANANLELVDYVGTTSTGNQLGKLSTLLAWHELDPVDDFERKRNEKIYTTYQHNRNPFIDHPTWVTAVFDPEHFEEETITWMVNVTTEGTGWVNGESGSFTAEVTNSLTKTFFVQPDAAAYYHIGSISWNGAQVPQAYYTNAAYYNYTTPAVTNNATLAVVFAPDTAALGTPIPWLVQYGYTNDWDAAELADPNDDGVPNWQEYLNGTDPTALSLRQVTGVTVTATNNAGFTLAWNAVDYADGYRVRVCSTAVVDAASAGFEGRELDAGWSVSEKGTALATNAALAGEWGLAFSTNGAWLASPAVANPASVEFKYKRSSSTAAWTLAVDVSVDGGSTWTEAGNVTNATTTAKTGSVDLSAWYGQTVTVRLRDARESGNAARYVDAVVVRAGGATVDEATTSATSWTATGLSAGTGYDVFVRGEATTLGTAVGPWSQAVRATTTPDASGRKAQSITFLEIADQTVGATVTLDAAATSGLDVTYSWSGPATLSGNVLTCTGEGTVTVSASQAGNEEWAPAEDVEQSFEVTAAPVELVVPERLWASATNVTSFTAAWSEVAGAEGYELAVWTGEPGGTGETETVLWSVDFTNYTGNGNTRLTNDFLAGWTVSNAFIGTNEFRVGASGAGGGVTSGVANVSGTIRVVTGARAWASDSDVVLHVGVGGTIQTNALTGTNETITSVFENVEGEIQVSWSTPAGKKRFFLNVLEVAEIGTMETKDADMVPVPGYEALAVNGTSCVVTGLTASTEYFFKVRARAGEANGPWSETATVTMLAEDEPPEPETTLQTLYEAWVAGLPVESTDGLEYATAAATDSDGDGFTNWQEYLADTNPKNSNDCFSVTATTNAAGEVLLRSDEFSVRRRYALLVYTNLDVKPEPEEWWTGEPGMVLTNSLPKTSFLRLEVGLP